MLAIGPLTNLAALLAAGVRPGRVAVMGGVLTPIQHRGRRYEIEHNFASDPAAVAPVLELAPDLLVCPLDVTVRLRIPDDRVADFFAAAPVLEELCESWTDPIRLHDPLALLALLGEPMRVDPPGAPRRRWRRAAVGASGRARRASSSTTSTSTPRWRACTTSSHGRASRVGSISAARGARSSDG